MNIETLLPRLRSAFERCVLLPNISDIVRCEHLYRERSRSIYFFQATASLPEQAELLHLHETVVSPSYFSTEGAARWSHYLVFVTEEKGQSRSGFRKRKQDIEEDKNYARKFVICASDLNAFLDRSVIQPAVLGGATSVVDIWATRLQAAGLERIQSDDPRAPFVRRIREGLTNSSTVPTLKAPAIVEKEPPPQIRVLDVSRFGDRKLSGTFELGRVNLIRGPNGSGKTSFLEAIEHYFCGSTFRSKGAASEFVASATFSNGRVVPYRARSNLDYQAMDRRWYGRTTTRGNRLYEGFARFNFLNTDAAVHFSTDGELRNLIELLSVVALGPDAAHTWTRIEQFADEIDVEIRPLTRQSQTLTQNIANASARLAVLKTISPQSEALWAHAREALRVIDWPPLGLPDADAEVSWFLQFQSLRSFAASSATIGTARSVDELRSVKEGIARDTDLMGKLKAELSQAAKERAELQGKRSLLYRRRERLERLRQYLQVDYQELLNSREQLTSELGVLSSILVPDADRLALVSMSTELQCQDKSLSDFEQALSVQLASNRADLETAEQERGAIVRRLSQTDAVIADIRRLGRQYSELHPEAAECPLCHTQMTMTDLTSRLDSLRDLAAQTEVLDARTRKGADLNRDILEISRVLLTVARIARSAGGYAIKPVAAAAEEMARVKVSVAECQARLAQLDSRFNSLGAAGYSKDEYTALSTELAVQLGIIKPEGSADLLTVDTALVGQGSLESSLAKQEEATHAIAASLAVKNTEFATKYNSTVDEDLVVRLRSRISGLENAIAEVSALPASVSKRFSTDLQALLRLGSDALKALDDLNSQIQTERARIKEIDVLEDQRKREEQDLAAVAEQTNRLKAALNVLRDLQANHSLQSGLSEFLSANVGAIQRIFTKIHVPHELRLSSLANCTLKRIGSEADVDLAQISTGQRAAFMLSVFLTLNLSLRSGPPFMLIDDPIAHIDDLNALSFLDFLADVAESNQRQIFFATANEKLANVFQKKMEFLGNSDFRSIDMQSA